MTGAETGVAGSPRRTEDPRLLSGGGCFVADLALGGMLHGVFVRSPHAHATIRGVDASAATRAGARLVLTARDLPFLERRLVVRRWHPSIRDGLPPPLARERVRYVGEAVAFLVAADRYRAEDLAELVAVDYAPLPVLGSPGDALRPGALRLHDAWADNVAARFEQRVGDAAAALAAAERRMRRHFRFPRQTPVPLETRGCVAKPDALGFPLTVWVSTQVPYNVRANLAAMLELPESDIRVIAPDVGGGFGAKARTYWEEVVVGYAALRLGRPVTWIEDRREHFVATTHSRDIDVELEVGYTRTGRLTALRARVVADIGAYVHGNGVVTAEVVGAHLAGPYRIPHYHAEVVCVGTNKTPLATYRGAGQPEATFPVERTLDLIAKDLGLSPEDVRRENLVEPAELPYSPGTTFAGVPVTFESGNFPAVLGRAVELGRSAPRSGAGPDETVGQGLALGLEVTGLGGSESARVRVEADGSVTVHSGLSTQGQGQPTTLAQICADVLGVPLGAVTVRMGDTALLPFGKGTFASRGAVLGGNAVAQAAARVRSQVVEAAARLLEARAGDLVVDAGRIYPRGSPSAGVTLAEVARAVSPSGPLFRGGPILEAEGVFGTEGDAGTYALSAHVATVAVNRRTGECRVLDYVVVHDVGRWLNARIVDGQVHGGVVEGLGGALLGELVHDEAGQLVSGTLMDYLLPVAVGLPAIRVGHVETRPTTNPYGVRGVGEGGTLPVAPAIANAVSRALGERLHGGEDLLCTLPLTPEMLLRAAEPEGNAWLERR